MTMGSDERCATLKCVGGNRDSTASHAFSAPSPHIASMPNAVEFPGYSEKTAPAI